MRIGCERREPATTQISRIAPALCLKYGRRGLFAVPMCFLCLMCLICLICLVCFVCLMCLIYLICLVCLVSLPPKKASRQALIQDHANQRHNQRKERNPQRWLREQLLPHRMPSSSRAPVAARSHSSGELPAMKPPKNSRPHAAYSAAWAARLRMRSREVIASATREAVMA